MFKRLFLVVFTATALVAWPAMATASHETAISVSPDRVAPGESITVDGTCGPDAANQHVDVVLGGAVEGGLLAADVPTDGQGDFSLTHTLAVDAVTGDATVFASCGLGSARDPSVSLTISDATTESTVVAAGDTGELVAFWQDRLNDWIALSDGGAPAVGLTQITVDGVFGPETEDATRVFQDLSAAVPTDGVVHPEDRVALREAIDSLESEDGVTDAVVAPGDTGELVAFWQDRLNEYFTLKGSEEDTITVDGVFGPATEGATREFQIVNDAVEPDGVVHPEDRVALREAIDALESDGGATDTVVARGDTGDLVAFWQDRLNDWFALSDTADPITVDGIFGPATEEATLVFQQANGTVPADAVVDPEDRVALREAIDAVETEPEVPSTDAAVSPGYPASGEPALLTRILTRQVDGNDQIIFEYEAGDDFSFKVDYVEEAIAASGQPVEVEGDYDLLVATAPAARVDLSGDEPVETYTGAERFEPKDLNAVAEIALVEDFEGAMTWVLGTTVDSPFRVETEDDPLRLVITLTQE